MRAKFFLTIAPALVLAAMPLGAQSAGAGAQARGSAQAQTPQARIDAAFNTAVEAGIPASLLQSKVNEGRAKGVAAERIAVAVETRLAALMRAWETVKRAQLESTTAAELSVTADALEAGVSENALVRIYRNAPPERRTVAVAVLADLVRLGNGSEPSFARVNAALRSSAALANLQAEVAVELKRGGLPSTLGVGAGAAAGAGVGAGAGAGGAAGGIIRIP